MEERDWDLRGDVLATEAIGAGRPTTWFDQLYSEGEAGSISMPWDRSEPHPMLREWAEREGLSGDGRRAVVVGCGLGADAAYLASLGFATTAFDVSPTAVRLAQERHPGGGIDFRVADLLHLPDEWLGAFDVVVEIFTVQALPDPPRPSAVEAVRSLVAPGGTLVAIAFRLTDGVDPSKGPPFALPRSTMDAFAGDELETVRVEALEGPRWRAVFGRPTG